MTLKKTVMESLEALERYKPGTLFDPELISRMIEITNQAGKEVIVYQDMQGAILEAAIGEKTRAQADLPNSVVRMSGIRNLVILHTHPGGNAHLSDNDLSVALIQRPAAMVAISSNSEKPFAGVAIPNFENDELFYEQAILPIGKLQESAGKLRENRNDVNKHFRTFNQFEEEDRGEKAILIGVDSGEETVDFETSMKELELLSETAGAEVLAILSQKMDKPKNATYFGEGKISEVRDLIQNKGANLIIANDELAPAQIQTLEAAGGVKVIDRTQLILDIFADHAISAEGRIQVELAQQRYRLSRLRGLGEVLSRTGGGIGTRGPGEKKLETDRRRILSTIHDLEKKLERIEKNHDTTARERKRNDEQVVSLVGYTNAGKSTLFNRLTDADVLEKNALFVTLDSTVRKSKEKPYLLSDTVGFIDKLPHQLIRAFKTTLQEAREANVLLFVIDAADDKYKEREEVVESVLKEIGCAGPEMKRIYVYNKIDLLSDKEKERILNNATKAGRTAVAISARTGEGIEKLLLQIDALLHEGKTRVKLMIPYERGEILSRIHKQAEVLSQEHGYEGTILDVRIDKEKLKAYEEFRIRHES